MKPRAVLFGSFLRPYEGPRWTREDGSAVVGWRSHGGAGARHPHRLLPRTLVVDAPQGDGRLASVSLTGVLAEYASADLETPGAIGASVQLVAGDQAVFSLDLVQGRHYSDATLATNVFRLNGDGTSVETVGRWESLRTDRLTIDVPGGTRVDRLVFRDSGTPASFVVFDVAFEFEEVGACPFRGNDGHVALSEIGSILRLRDRARFDTAMHQVVQGIHDCGRDLDEARGLALTFLAAVVAAMLEIAPHRSMHKVQLETARKFDQLSDPTAIAAEVVARVRGLTDGHIHRTSRTGDALIDQALEIMSRSFTADLDADSVAKQLSLSTSHFRHLFREATRQPFQRYLVSLRLEKARELILQSSVPVTEIAETVGFQSPAHFSRAFSKRFGMAPSALRSQRRAND